MKKYELVKFKNGKFGVRCTKKALFLSIGIGFVNLDLHTCFSEGQVHRYCTMTEAEARDLLAKVDLFPEEVVSGTNT